MNRAQQIRNARLEERIKIQEKRTEHDLKVKKKAKELFDWILDLFENPTKENTADKVEISDSYTHKMFIGYEKLETKRTFDDEVVEEVVDMFNKEEGFEAKYIKGRFPDSFSSAVIEIK